MIVVDASVIVTALADDGRDGQMTRDRLVGESLLAPHLVDVEVTSAWRRLVASGHLTEGRAGQALTDFSDLRIQRAPHQPLLRRCWQLRHNLSVYDGCYVALAEFAESVLVTADSRIAAAPGTACDIEVLSF